MKPYSSIHSMMNMKMLIHMQMEWPYMIWSVMLSLFYGIPC